MGGSGKQWLWLLALLLAGTGSWAGGGRNRAVNSPVSISYARTAPVIDGDLGEWSSEEAVNLGLAYYGGAGGSIGVFHDYSCRAQLRYDDRNLYLGVWFNRPVRPTPEGAGAPTVPPGDGLVLGLGRGRHPFIAFYPGPDGTLQARGLSDSLGRGESVALPEVRQAIQRQSPERWTHEIAVPLSLLELDPVRNPEIRLALEVCYANFDPEAGYRAWFKTPESGNRWGAGMAWGISDGVIEPTLPEVPMSPSRGATVTLAAAGTRSPGNATVVRWGNERTLTDRLIAVPAGQIRLDGRLSPGEWAEESGTVIAFEPTLLPGRYGVKVFLAYDQAGLYLGLRFAGGIHRNICDPAVYEYGYEGGDSVQLRLKIGDRVTHLDAWYCDDARKDAVGIQYGENFNEGRIPDAITRGGAVSKVSPRPEGGYDQELFLPWSLIAPEGVTPKLGDTLQLVFDLWFGGREGNRVPFVLNGSFEPDTAVVKLPFTAPVDGVYSAMILDASGRGITRAASMVRLKKGEQLTWDGRDEYHKLVPPGKYAFKGIYHTGIDLKYLMTYNSPGKPPWQTADGRGEWGGDHSPPQGAVSDGEHLYFAWVGAEDGYSLLCTDLAGQRQWGYYQQPRGTPSGNSLLAIDNGVIYLLNDIMTRHWHGRAPGEKELAYFATVISAYDARTGSLTAFSRETPAVTLREFSTRETPNHWFFEVWQDHRNFTVDNAWHRDFYWFSDRMTGGSGTGIAARDGKVYVSLRLDNVVKVFDGATMRELRALPLPKPGALAFDRQGRLFALSGDQLCELDPESGRVLRTVVTGLKAPAGLLVDDAGQFYVSLWGDRQCIEVYDAQGRAVRTIGKPGGRNWVGRFEEEGMLFPQQMALDRNGELWVTENIDSPRRISVWNSADGRYLRDYIGSTNYGGITGGYLDPEEPTIGLSSTTLFKLDFDRKTSRPLATLWRRFDRNQYLSPEVQFGSLPGFVRHDGRLYLGLYCRSAFVVGEITKEGVFVARAAVGGIFNRGDVERALPDDKLEWPMTVAPEFFHRKVAPPPGSNYIWCDRNGDGLMSEDEVEFRPADDFMGVMEGYWGGGRLAEDFTIYKPSTHGVRRMFGFKVKEWLPNGAPVYSFDQVEALAPFVGEVGGTLVDRAKNSINNQFGEWRKWSNDETRLTSYAPDGTVNWSYFTGNEGDRTPGNIVGEKLMGPFKVNDELGEIFTMTQWHGCYLPLITTDGIYFGRVLRDPAAGGPAGPDIYRGESIQAATLLKDGRLIFTHGKNAHNLFEVTGLDRARRFAGEFELTAADLDRARALEARQQEEASRREPVKLMIYPERKIEIDGELGEWDWNTASRIGGPDRPRAEVALASLMHDSTLYLAFKVYKDGRYVNKASRVQQLFIGGDAVELQFNNDPQRPARRTMGDGDRRIVIGKFEGRPVAVFYNARVPFTRQPVGFSSPARTIYFDQVQELPGVQIAIKDTDYGYNVEARIPMHGVITAAEAPGFWWHDQLVRGDVGVIIGDATGRRVQRLYRFNQDATIVNDIPSEAELTPQNWGTFQVVDTTVKN